MHAIADGGAHRRVQIPGLDAGCSIGANANEFRLKIDEVIVPVLRYPTTPSRAVWQRAILDLFRIVYSIRYQPHCESEYMLSLVFGAPDQSANSLGESRVLD